MPVESLRSSGRSWSRYDTNPGYMVCDAKDPTHYRILYVGESKTVKDFLRKKKFLPDSVLHRILERIRIRRRDPAFWSQFYTWQEVSE